MRNSQGHCLTALDFNLEFIFFFQYSLSVLEVNIANLIFLKLFITKCKDRVKLLNLGYSLVKLYKEIIN
jgi:hypothetical protein